MTEEPPIEFKLNDEKEFVWRCLKCGSEIATFPSSMKCPHCDVTFQRQLKDSSNFVASQELERIEGTLDIECPHCHKIFEGAFASKCIYCGGSLPDPFR